MVRDVAILTITSILIDGALKAIKLAISKERQ
jgi:hypothetical protein